MKIQCLVEDILLGRPAAVTKLVHIHGQAKKTCAHDGTICPEMLKSGRTSCAIHCSQDGHRSEVAGQMRLVLFGQAKHCAVKQLSWPWCLSSIDLRKEIQKVGGDVVWQVFQVSHINAINSFGRSLQ